MWSAMGQGASFVCLVMGGMQVWITHMCDRDPSSQAASAPSCCTMPCLPLCLPHTQIATKAQFWTQNNFYGVDVTPLYAPAVDGYFGQVG